MQMKINYKSVTQLLGLSPFQTIVSIFHSLEQNGAILMRYSILSLS